MGAGLHPLEDEPADDWDVVASESDFACAVAMFARAARPLEGMHPDLARLLARNVERDASLNARLTDLARLTGASRSRAAQYGIQANGLRGAVESALARAEAAESAARAAKRALSRLQTRYVEYCASALQAVDEQDAAPDETRPSIRGAVAAGHRAPPLHPDERDAAEVQFRLAG